MPFSLAQLIITVPALLFAITIHEYAHGKAALWMGDPTAYRMGRLTLNPLPHIDPFGAICLFLFSFGWAKPVPIDPRYFRNIKAGIIFTSLCGPLANLSAAFLTGILIRTLSLPLSNHPAIAVLCLVFLRLNIGLGLFNLLPIPPLDGSHILENLLSPKAAESYRSFARYGPLIILGVVMLDNFAHTGILSAILIGPMNYLAWLFSGIKF